jgi:hypothetical protein
LEKEAGVMEDKRIFDYYYGQEAELFSFYRIPRMLIRDPHFSDLSNDAKILYGLMLDRMSLSIKNGWQDEEDRTYIVYTIENIQEDLNCGKNKAIKTLAELDSSQKGIGLVEKRKRGCGLPDILYVKNFVGVQVAAESDYLNEKKLENTEKSASKGHKSVEVSNVNLKKFKKQTSRSLQNKPQEVSKTNLKEFTNETTGSLESKPQEVCKTNPNYTENNYTDSNQNESRYTEMNQTEGDNPIIPSGKASMDRIDEMNIVREYLREIIDYDVLIGRKGFVDRKIIDELIEVMVDAITSKSETIRINGEDIPKNVVQSRFEKYDMELIQYVCECLGNNTTKVKNIRSYLLTTLYNAPTTISSYYQAEVNHDMYGSD